MGPGVAGVDMVIVPPLVMVVFDNDIGIVITQPLLMVEVDVLEQTKWYLHVTLTDVQ